MAKKNETTEKAAGIEEVAMDAGMEAFFSEDISESTAPESESEGTRDENMYATSLKHENVQGGVYKSRVRFIKNPFNTKDDVCNILHKWMYFLPHPDITDGNMVLDCTSNFGAKHKDNIISQAFFYLRSTKQPSLMNLAKQHFSRKSYYFTLLKVIADGQQADMVDKIKVYRFANQVNEKIEGISQDDASVGVKGVNFSHPFTGRDFIIDVRLESFKDEKTGKTKEMTSYSKSKFVDESSILTIPGYPEEKIATTKEYMMDLYNWMKENSPNLADYKPVLWNEEQEDRAIRAVQMIIEDDNIFNKIYRKQYKKSFVFGTGESTKEESSGLQIKEESLMKEEEKAPIVEEEEKAPIVEEEEIPTAQADLIPEDDEDDEF